MPSADMARGTLSRLSIVWGTLAKFAGRASCRPGSNSTHTIDAVVPQSVRPTCAVLTIDDDPTHLDIVKLQLTEAGYTVLTASSGAKGLNMLRYGPADLRVVVLDYNMPEMDGLATLRHIRRLKPAMKVIGLSGETSATLPPEFVTGVDGFLSKPYRNADLVAAIAQLTAQQS